MSQAGRLARRAPSEVVTSTNKWSAGPGVVLRLSMDSTLDPSLLSLVAKTGQHAAHDESISSSADAGSARGHRAASGPGAAGGHAGQGVLGPFDHAAAAGQADTHRGREHLAMARHSSADGWSRLGERSGRAGHPSARVRGVGPPPRRLCLSTRRPRPGSGPGGPVSRANEPADVQPAGAAAGCLHRGPRRQVQPLFRASTLASAGCATSISTRVDWRSVGLIGAGLGIQFHISPAVHGWRHVRAPAHRSGRSRRALQSERKVSSR